METVHRSNIFFLQNPPTNRSFFLSFFQVTVTPMLEDDAAISGSHDVIKTTDDNNNTTTKHEGSTATFSDGKDMSSLIEDQENNREGRVFGDRVILDRPGKVQSANAKDRSGSSVKSSIRDRKVSKDPVRDDGSADGIVFRETSTHFASIIHKDSDLKIKDDQNAYAAIKHEGLQNVATGFVFDSDEMLNTLIHLDHQKQPQQQQEDKEQQEEGQQQQEQQQQQQKKEQQQRGQKQPRRRTTALNGRFVRGGPVDSSFPGNISSERNINIDNTGVRKQQHLVFKECNKINGDSENSECNGNGSSDNSNSNIHNSSKDISNISSNTTTDPTGTGLIGKTKKRPRNPGNP